MMSQDEEQAQQISIDCPLISLSPRWIRVKFGNRIIADSKQALLLREYGSGILPTYYFPQSDVDLGVLTQVTANTDGDNTRRFWTIDCGEKRAEKAAWTYHQPSPEYATLKDYISFHWDEMDAWYEEDEEIFVHARDPYKRIDVLRSKRHIRIELEGQPLAESVTPFLLFETSLPTRYYLPVEHVNREKLIASAITSRCPYKGIAQFWSVNLGDRVIEDIVWSYPNPIAEMPKIRNLMCFYNEHVDLYLDGELQKRPRTKWS